VLRASAAAGLSRFVMASTTMGYGPGPENPNYLAESRTLAGHPRAHCVQNRVEVEHAVQAWSQSHSETQVTVLRHCWPMGPRYRNYVHHALEAPVVTTCLGYDPLLQFIHEEDLLNVYEELPPTRVLSTWWVGAQCLFRGCSPSRGKSDCRCRRGYSTAPSILGSAPISATNLPDFTTTCAISGWPMGGGVGPSSASPSTALRKPGSPLPPRAGRLGKIDGKPGKREGAMVPRRGTGVSESGTGAGRRAENNVVSLASKRSESSSMLAEGEALETLRAALDDLRREIRTQLPRPGADDEAQARAPGRVDWFALFDELRVRLGHLGMRESSGEIDEFGMDFDLVERMRPLLDFLAEKYWRIDLRGDEHIPDAGPALYVANRSGLLPYDGWMLAHLVEKIGGGDPRPHFMVDDDLMALPFLQPVLARAGGVLACPENAERLLASGHSVVIFPEGMRGAIKTFDQRYELQGFGHHALLGAASEAGVPPSRALGGGFRGRRPDRSRRCRGRRGNPAHVVPFVPGGVDDGAALSSGDADLSASRSPGTSPASESLGSGIRPGRGARIPDRGGRPGAGHGPLARSGQGSGRPGQGAQAFALDLTQRRPAPARYCW